MPKFSIIIPVYNVAPYLRECLDSVVAQTFTDWETICVDDGSTDGSGVILDEYSREDARIKVIHSQNRGVSAARNAGLDHLRGDAFLFLDADDVLPAWTLACYLKAFQHFQADAVFSGVDFCRFETPAEREQVLSVCARQFENWHVCDAEVLKDCRFRLSDPDAPVGCVCGGAFSAIKFGRVRFPAGVKMMEDLRVCAAMTGVASTWVRVDLPLYLYRDRKGSAVYSVDFGARFDVLSAHSDVLDAWGGSANVPETIRADYWKRYRRHFTSTFFEALKTWHRFSPNERTRLYHAMLHTSHDFQEPVSAFRGMLLGQALTIHIDLPYVFIYTLVIRVWNKIAVYASFAKIVSAVRSGD